MRQFLKQLTLSRPCFMVPDECNLMNSKKVDGWLHRLLSQTNPQLGAHHENRKHHNAKIVEYVVHIDVGFILSHDISLFFKAIGTGICSRPPSLC